MTGRWAATNALRKQYVTHEEWHANQEALALVETALDAAEAWWQSKRPVTWTDAEHAAQPYVNCVGPHEQALAAALRAVREGK